MPADRWELLAWVADREDNEPGMPTIRGADLMRRASGLAGDDAESWNAIARAAAYLRKAGFLDWQFDPYPNGPPEPPIDCIEQINFQQIREIGVTAQGRAELANRDKRAGERDVTEEPKYWHVIVVPTNKKRQEGSSEAVAIDKDRAWVETRILEPRRRGESFALRGRTFDWSDVGQLKITVSQSPAAEEIPRIEAKWRASRVLAVGRDAEWNAAFYATDVTDDLIDGPPGTASEAGPAPPRVNSKAVMVVYGRDSEARRAMFDFLRALKLDPQEWGKLIERTGKATPYVGEVLERAFEEAAAVVVVLTPDDEAQLRDEFQSGDDPEYERALTPQARPNVLFEAGMAFGIHPDRTVLVELGSLRPFSDVGGRHVVRLDGTPEPLREIARRLKAAGCDVDESGDDWTAPARFPQR